MGIAEDKQMKLEIYKQHQFKTSKHSREPVIGGNVFPRLDGL